jgi:hypothetical protein
LVETYWAETYNFFTDGFVKEGEGRNQSLKGSIVLYGHFGTTTTIDKVHGVFEDTTLAAVANGLNSDATYTVTFKDANGETLQTVEDVAFGATVSYNGQLPTPEKTQDALFTYAYAWDKTLGKITADTEYTLTLVATPKSGVQANKVSVGKNDSLVFAASEIGSGANYQIGQNNGGYVRQSYLGLDGNYGLNNYVVFDFTGKNMPEIAFFANKYNDSMYAEEGTSKTGIVVVTGITTWDGEDIYQVNNDKPKGTVINYGFPYMIQDANDGGFCQGAFKTSALGRANLVDDTHYRLIMGFTETATDVENHASKITLKWCLYNLDTNQVVEEESLTTWHFFNGSTATVGNLTRDQLSGSIVLYGKFGVALTIDKLYGVESGNYADVVAKYTPSANA